MLCAGWIVTQVQIFVGGIIKYAHQYHLSLLVQKRRRIGRIFVSGLINTLISSENEPNLNGLDSGVFGVYRILYSLRRAVYLTLKIRRESMSIINLNYIRNIGSLYGKYAFGKNLRQLHRSLLQ